MPRGRRTEPIAKATIRPGARPALLVVDFRVGFMAAAWDAARVIGNVALAVERARAQGVPVSWVQHGDQQLVPGSEARQWVPPLQPRAGECGIHKRHNSEGVNEPCP